MNTLVRKTHPLALLIVFVVFLLSGLAACGAQANVLPITTQANAQSNTTASELGATTVVKKYLQLFNAGMRSGDFSAMASVYAPDATLKQSNPKGVTTVLHGLAAIISFYQGLLTKFPGYQWTVESMRSLAPNVVLVYQHAGSPPLRIAGRCIHVFVVEDGKITSYDWATYYPGQQ
jgi:hypothetical protein